MVQESLTCDEAHYFGLGKYLLQTGRWDVPGSILHPPLSYYLHSIPLLFVSTDDTLWKQNPGWQHDAHYRAILDVERGRALLSSPANDGDRLLTLSRLMMVLVALLLGWYVFSWSFALYGNSGAIIAVVLYSFCPNILAHARLITPDIVLTTFFFAAVYYFWRMLREDRLSIAVIGGIALGLALLSKFTAVLLVPLCVVLALFWLFQTKSLPWRGCLIFGAVGLAVLLVGYRGNLEPYFAGLQYQRECASQPRWVFLCGECLPRRWGCYFFTMALLLKTPLAAMIGMVLAIMVFVKKALRGEWISEIFLVAPALAIFVLYAVHAQCLGLRYLLPMYPFLFVFIAGGIACLLSRRIMAVVCGGLATWYLGASLYIHPHYLAYFNELAGGPDNGYKYFVDSNLDWGQDLKGLGQYMREHHITKVCLSYFGSDSPERYGIAYEPLPGCKLNEPTRDQKKATDATAADYVAVSATNLQMVSSPDIDMYAALRNREPVAKIGYSIFIYPNVDIVLDDSGRLDEAIAHHRKALEIRPDFAGARNNLGLLLARLGRLDEAITEYRKALEINPDYVKARNNLGNALVGRGQIDEAIAEYRKVLEIDPDYFEAHNNLGNIMAGHGQIDEAVAEYRKALEISPQVADLHYNLGVVLAGCGRFDEAITEYERALQIKPIHTSVQHNLGIVQSQREEILKALAGRRESLRLRPDDVALLNDTAWVLATNPNASIRNGAEAIELAQARHDSPTGENRPFWAPWPRPMPRRAAFPRRCKRRKALQLAAEQGKQPLAESLKAKIPLYEAGAPYHEIPQATASGPAQPSQ